MPADWFEDAYAGTPAWDIGRPQAQFVRLAESGRINGLVLDVGCGTGENALFMAGRGFETVGIDGAPTAIARARAKAEQRGLKVRFEIADALDLPTPDRPFDTVIDSGLFHVFSDDERIPFRESLARVVRPAGTYFMTCFSDRQPGAWGPRRVTQAEIRSVFSVGWRVSTIEAAEFETNNVRALAWLASISRLQ